MGNTIDSSRNSGGKKVANATNFAAAPAPGIHPGAVKPLGGRPSRTTTRRLVLLHEKGVRSFFFRVEGTHLSVIWGRRDRSRDPLLVVVDGLLDAPIAVCLRDDDDDENDDGPSSCYRIYTTRPNYPGQRPSERRYGRHRLYAYARVEQMQRGRRRRCATRSKATTTGRRQDVFLEGAERRGLRRRGRPSYTVHRQTAPRGGGGMDRLVRYRGRAAGRSSRATGGVRSGEHEMTVLPGVDQVLVICLTAICHEMD